MFEKVHHYFLPYIFCILENICYTMKNYFYQKIFRKTMRKLFTILIIILLPLISLSQTQLETLQAQLEKVENSLLTKQAEYQQICLDYEEARKNTADAKQEYDTANDNYKRGSQNVDLIPAKEMVKMLKKYKDSDKAYIDAKDAEKRIKTAKTKLNNDINELEKQEKDIKINILEIKAQKFNTELTKPIWSEGYGESVLDENKTMKECKQQALDYARRDAMDKGGKVLIESITEIKDFKLTKDEIKSRAKVQIIDQDNSGDYGKVKQEIVGNVMKFSVKVRVKLQSTTKYNPYTEQIAELKGTKNSAPTFIKDDDYSYSDEAIDGPLPGMKFVKIPAGSFQMGSNDGYVNEKPVHHVTIKSFQMMTTEITKAQWKTVMGNNPSNFQGDNLPVDNVSWNNCQEFIKKLNQLDTGKGYRLPTEAEWEYSCRAGSSTKYYTGDSESDLSKVSWYSDNSGNQTHPVGQKAPNAWGLYDMHGNVWEWCEDWYHDSYSGAPADGSALIWPSGQYRVLRGGFWCGILYVCRSAARGRSIHTLRSEYYGFRLVRSEDVADD